MPSDPAGEPVAEPVGAPGPASAAGSGGSAGSPYEPLVARHTLEFPGGYTRSVGPVIGRFMTELRDGRLVGVRTAAGKVIVPPTEYDPETGEPVAAPGGDAGGPGNGPGDDPYVPVGPAGTVGAWSWVPRPRPEHPLDRPFAWALITLDGADTALLHALDLGPYEPGSGPPKRFGAGARVRPRWRAARTGHISDIECFVPEVTTMVAPSRLDYTVPAGEALGRFLAGLAERVFLGGRCGSCAKTYVPLRVTCPACGRRVTEEVRLPGTGTITTFAINNIPDPRAPEVPFVSAYVRLDGADIAMLALVSGVPAADVRIGMRVRAAWADEVGPTMASVKWFEPAEPGS